MARCPASSSAWVTIPTGLVKSRIQLSGRAAPRGLLGDLEDQRHRAQGLREPAGPGGLLADEAEPERQRLVDEARRLAADAQLDQRVRGAVEGGATGRR